MVIDDDAVIKGSNIGEPIALDPKSKASLSYRNIARCIIGESVPLLSLEELEDDKPSFFGKIKKLVGIN